jgi:membrane-bound metal-dependent hydrolase YbcI (DUF457 family)
MMGRQHALTGVLAGVGFAAAVPAAPTPIRALLVVVTGGAALLPDLDHPSATAARSLGVLTKVIAIGMDRLALSVYHATRGPRDTAARESGHRLFTHTLPACVLAGGVVGLLVLVYPVLVALVAALLAGLLALGFKRAGGVLAIGAGLVTWWALTQHPGWSWLFPAAVTLGCAVHIMGDMVTNSGVPVLWPIERAGKRWAPVRTPVTFNAGGPEEQLVVAPLLLLAVALSVSWSTGLLAVVVSAVAAIGGV